MAIFARMALLGLLFLAFAVAERRSLVEGAAVEHSSEESSSEETEDDDHEIHIIYPSSSMCACYIIFDNPENVLQEAEAINICTEQLGLPPFQSFQDAPDTLQDVLLQAACRNIIVDYPKEETTGVSHNCFLRANVVHERWRMAYKYWQSLNDSSEAFFDCFGTTMNWVNEDGSINRDGVKSQVEAARGYTDALDGILTSIDECDEPGADLGTWRKLMEFFKCAYASCHDKELQEE